MPDHPTTFLLSVKVKLSLGASAVSAALLLSNLPSKKGRSNVTFPVRVRVKVKN
jgi:hypothetical protein